MVRAETDGGAAGGFDGETHHGFVDGADLFDVEGTVRDALAVQIQESWRMRKRIPSETSGGSISTLQPPSIPKGGLRGGGKRPDRRVRHAAGSGAMNRDRRHRKVAE